MSKEKTIGELLEEARKKSGAPKLAGHDIMDLERFAPDTRHMIVFNVLTHDSPIGWKGEKTRAFLTDQGYERSLENERLGHIKIRNHARVTEAIFITTIRAMTFKTAIARKGGPSHGGIPHRKDQRLYGDGEPSSAQ